MIDTHISFRAEQHMASPLAMGWEILMHHGDHHAEDPSCPLKRPCWEISYSQKTSDGWDNQPAFFGHSLDETIIKASKAVIIVELKRSN